MGTRPDVSLTRWLVFLVLGILVPLLLFGGTALFYLSRDAQVALDRGQVDTTRALALAVDGEVRSWRAALSALAASTSLGRGRWAEFDAEARQAAAEYGGWIVVNPAAGPQRINTLRPFGAPLPSTAAPEMVQRVFREGKPVTEMTFGAVAQRFIISSAIPVFRDGKVVYCLSLNFGPERLSRLLQSQQFPSEWLAAISDGHQRVVARSMDAEAWVGKPVIEWLAEAARDAASGIATGPILGGQPGQAAFHRLQEVPWLVLLVVPTAALPGAPIWGFILAGVLFGLAAVGLAVYTGRKVATPVRELARRSERLLQGEGGELGPPTGIREVRELQQALAQAAAAARERSEERERAAEALSQANAALEARVRERTAALETALAEAEEGRRLLTTLVENIPVGIAITGGPPDFRFKMISRHGLAMSQHPLESLAGVSAGRHQERWNIRLADGVTRPTPEQSPLYRAVRLGEEVRDCEMVLYAADGRRIDMLVDAVPIKDARGAVLGAVSCWHDISLRKQAEEALRRLNVDLEARVATRTAELSLAIETLERQARQLRALTAELALAEQRERRRLADLLHDELQQLLVATRLRAHMLGRAADPAAREGADEVVALIEEALAVTRTLTGELQPPALQRGALLPALGWLARWMAEKHHLTVRLEPPPVPLPALPEELAVLLYRAARELLLNAVKYAQAAEAVVTVTQDAAALTVTVADLGVGFDPARLRVTGGSEGGYGLLGIRERLEWVGGRLELASAPGQGSRIGLVIPLGPAPAASPLPPSTAPPAAAPENRPLRVLVVDDHALVRRGLATLLASEPDLRVVGEAADGEQAVEATRRLAPDVILMDVRMPRLNGIEATRVIRAEWPAVRVIGLSVVETAAQAEAMRQAGAVAHLGKNVPAETLLETIRRAAG